MRNESSANSKSAESSVRLFRCARFPVELEQILIDNFSYEKTGRETAQSAGLDKKTVDKYFLNIRSRISRCVLKQNREKLARLDFAQKHLLSRTTVEGEDLRNFKSNPKFPILYISLPDRTSIAEVFCSTSAEDYQIMEKSLSDLSKREKITYGITDWNFRRKETKFMTEQFYSPIATNKDEGVRGSFYDFVNFLLNRRRTLYGAAPHNRYAVLRLHEDQWRFSTLSSIEELIYTCVDYPSFRNARCEIPFKRPKNIWQNLPGKLSEILKDFPD